MSRNRQKTPADEEDITPIEKGDMFAMWLSGMLTVGLPCIIMIGIIIAAVLLLFG